MKQHTQNLVNAFGFISTEEAELLMQTAEQLKPNAVVVNIGAGVGTSALAIIEQRPNLAKTFYTIDIRDDDNPFGGLLNERHAFQNANMTELLPNQIKSDSSTAGLNWKHGEIDFLIIDADHSYEAVVKDINAWIPHLAINGFVAFHDYEATKWVDVKTAVDEFIAANPEYKLVKRADTMIVYEKTEPRKVKITKDLTESEREIKTVEEKTEVKNEQEKPTKSTSAKLASAKKS